MISIVLLVVILKGKELNQALRSANNLADTIQSYLPYIIVGAIILAEYNKETVISKAKSEIEEWKLLFNES